MERQPIPDVLPPTREIKLTETQREVLGCIACISAGGNIYAGEARRQASACTQLSRNTLNRAFTNLEQDKLIDSRPRTTPPKPGTIGPSQNEHTITEKGKACLPAAWQPCERKDADNPISNLTENQLGYLRCIACLMSRNKEPAIEDIAYCVGKDAAIINGTLKKLSVRGVLEQQSRTETVRRWGGRNRVKYVPSEAVAPHMPTPGGSLDCKNVMRHAETAFAGLTETQRRALGCIACLTNKAKHPEIAGAENVLVAQCQNIHPRTIVGATARLRELGIIESVRGFSRNHNRTILVPTDLGRQIASITTQANTCTTDMSGVAHEAIPLEKTIGNCLGCIWAKQIASEEKPAATTSMIASCSGFSQKSVLGVIRKMIEAGEVGNTLTVDKILNTGRAVPAYNPTTRLRALPPTGKDCQLPVYTNIPAGYLKPLLPDTFALPPREKLKHIYREPWFREKLRHDILDLDEEQELARIIQDGSDFAAVDMALQKFVAHNFKLALWGVRRYPLESAYLPFSESLSAAEQGVLVAAQRYKPDMDTRFSSYAGFWIRQAIQREAAQNIEVPLDDFRLFGKVYHAAADFRQQYGRLPSVVELAQDLQLSPKYVDRIIEYRRHAIDVMVNRLDAYISNTDTDTTYQDGLGHTDASFGATELHATLGHLRQYLSPLEKTILTNIIEDMGAKSDGNCRRA